MVGVCRRTIRARSASLVIALSIALGGCQGADRAAGRLATPADAAQVDEAELAGSSAVAPVVLQVETYDSSGEVVHPDAEVFPSPWRGRRYWMAMTPYPLGNPAFENPSVFQGWSARRLTVPPGLANPVARPEALAHLSDPDVVHDPVADELRLYYRQSTSGTDRLFLSTSRDGVRWSPSRMVAEGRRYELISPAVVRETDASWRMWTVNASRAGCETSSAEMRLEERRSSDGVRWGAPTGVRLSLPGWVPWHWDVQYVARKGEYWTLVAAYPDGATCAQSAVFFGRSADGTAWTVSRTPLLAPGAFVPMYDLVYRSTFHYHERSDAVTVWFSGARHDGSGFRYAVATARYSVTDLLQRTGGASQAPVATREAGEGSAQTLGAARSAFVRDFP